jgi:hypothetical protein
MQGILNDREFHSVDKSEEAIPAVWDEFTFDEVKNIFYN